MELKKGDLVELMIGSLAFGGAGVGKMTRAESSGENTPDEKDAQKEFVVFVENTVPGDEVEARLTKIKPQYAEARLERIVTPSAQRITPRCKHFGVCGGCSLQFLPYEAQLKIKEQFVRDALTRLGGFKNPPIEKIIGCESAPLSGARRVIEGEAPWFYRNKMEYSVGEKGEIGLHPKKRYREVFEMEECFLQSELSVKIARSVQAWAREQKIAPYDYRRNAGVLKNLVVREGKNTGEVLVNLVVNGENIPGAKNDLYFSAEKFTSFMGKEFPQVTSLYLTSVTVKKGFKTIVKEELLAGLPVMHEKLLDLEFEILPQAFFQPNTKQAEVLYAKVLELAAPKKDDTVYDLFCGTGTIGMFFARKVKKVVGIELNASAIESAKENARRNKIKNIEFICGDVGRSLEKITLLPTIIVVDPPRAGLFNDALEKIAKLGASKIIYVSCNPTTLARDLKFLSNQYALKTAQPVDLFPQTYHVECVCLLERI